MKKIAFILAFFAFFTSLSASVERGEDIGNAPVMAGNCSSFTVMGNKAVFSCENNVKILIEQLGSGMLKIWVDQENFVNEKNSYAVLKRE
jgi:hypothetical protein